MGFKTRFTLGVCIVVCLTGCESWLNTEPDEGFCLGCSDAGTDGGADAGCQSNTMCTAASASKCDSGECVACVADADCSHIDGTNVCDEGTCVQCTVETEADHCGTNSCNPATKECTTTETGSLDPCDKCVADSECKEADNACVPMRFMGTDRDGGYCLKTAPCTSAPYTVPTTDERQSLSGATATTYCGIDEAVTTCEAVRQLIDNDFSEEQCADMTEDNDCGTPGLMDARCETVNTFINQCTYSCTSPSDCPTSRPCGNGYCGG